MLPVLSLDERYELYKETVIKCGSRILDLSDDEFKHILFEELSIAVYSFLHGNTLNELYEEGYIDEKMLDKSFKLRQMFQNEEQHLRDLMDVERIKGYSGFIKIINLADEIIDLMN